jgi:uncharacterized membrane protein
MEEITSSTSLFASEWIDYVVAVLFGVVVIALILRFSDNGPKKFLSILAVIGTVGLSIFFTRKKNKWSKEKLDRHNKKVDGFLATIKEREDTIKQNNALINDLSLQKKTLIDSASTDKDALEKLNQQIEERIEASKFLKTKIDDQQKVIQAATETINAENDLPSIDDILNSSTTKGEQK